MPPGANRTAQPRGVRGLRGSRHEVGRGARSSGLLLLNWAAFAVRRGAEHVGAQVVAGDGVVGSLLDRSAVLGRNYTMRSVKPIPNMRLLDTNSRRERCLTAAEFNCLFKLSFHLERIIKQLFYDSQHICCLLKQNSCFSVLTWR